MGWGEFGVYAGMIAGGLLGSIILYIYAKYDISKVIKSNRLFIQKILDI